MMNVIHSLLVNEKSSGDLDNDPECQVSDWKGVDVRPHPSSHGLGKWLSGLVHYLCLLRMILAWEGQKSKCLWGIFQS